MSETTNKTENIEESSRLLEASANADTYGLRAADNQIEVNNMGDYKKLPQIVAGLAAAGGALASGYILGWTSPAGPKLTVDEEYGFSISEDLFSWVGSAMTLGAAIICIPVGVLITIIGRKLTMLVMVLPFILGWLLLIFAQNIAMMIVARFILGIGAGAFCVAAPLYTGEIASKEIRGTLGTFFQLMITIGILFVYGIGWPLSAKNMSIVGLCIPIVFAVIFFFMPESPTYLVSKDKKEQAIKSIQWLRGSNFDYQPEIDGLEVANKKDQENKISIWNALKRKSTLKPLGISLGLMFLQQASGINAVIFYTNDIFTDAKTDIDQNLATIIVGIMQVGATFLATMIIDKVGRRILLLLSAIVMATCTVLMGVYFFMQSNDESSVENIGWLPILSLCVFIIMFSIGFGPVPWLMMGELFASDIKGVCGSIAGTSNWILAFIVTKVFVNMKDAFGSGPTFWIFSAITYAGAVFVFYLVPETKGKSLAEIQSLFED